MENWKDIRLELAPTKEFPTGSVSRGYLVRLPLDDGDGVDLAAYEHNPHRATVRRYWSTEPDEAGRIYPVGGNLALRCNGKPDRQLELNGYPLRLGQTLSVLEPDGIVLPFRIASVR